LKIRIGGSENNSETWEKTHCFLKLKSSKWLILIFKSSIQDRKFSSLILEPPQSNVIFFHFSNPQNQRSPIFFPIFILRLIPNFIQVPISSWILNPRRSYVTYVVTKAINVKGKKYQMPYIFTEVLPQSLSKKFNNKLDSLIIFLPTQTILAS